MIVSPKATQSIPIIVMTEDMVAGGYAAFFLSVFGGAPLLTQTGHAIVRCTCLLLTQSHISQRASGDSIFIFFRKIYVQCVEHVV